MAKRSTLARTEETLQLSYFLLGDQTHLNQSKSPRLTRAYVGSPLKEPFNFLSMTPRSVVQGVDPIGHTTLSTAAQRCGSDPGGKLLCGSDLSTWKLEWANAPCM